MAPTSSLYPLTIHEPDDDSDRKSRSFTVACLGWVTAEALCDRQGLASTPVFLALAGATSTLRTFLANFLHGNEEAHVATSRDLLHRLRRPKGLQLRSRWNRDADPALFLAWHPAFELNPDPAESGDAIEFVSMPRRSWLDEQSRSHFADADDPAEAARAAHFCALLARRTRLPIAADPAFRRHLFSKALEAHWTGVTTGHHPSVQKRGLAGFADPVVCRVPHATFETWLRERTREFFS